MLTSNKFQTKINKFNKLNKIIKIKIDKLNKLLNRIKITDLSIIRIINKFSHRFKEQIRQYLLIINKTGHKQTNKILSNSNSNSDKCLPKLLKINNITFNPNRN